MRDVIDNLLISYPGLREWRRFRVALIAASLEAIGTLFLIVYWSDLGRDIVTRVPAKPMDKVFTVAVYLFPASAVVAIVGLFIDKKKVPCLVALGMIFPLLTMAGIWSGKW